MSKEYSYAINFAAKRITIMTDQASKTLGGPRFMFQEYIDEIASIIDEELNTERIDTVEEALDGREIKKLKVEIEIENVDGWDGIKSVVCNGEKIEGQESSGTKYFWLHGDHDTYNINITETS